MTEFTSETWPIGAALLQAPRATPDGTPMHAAPPAAWRSVLREVRRAGFDHVDLTDSWLPVGSLRDEQVDDLASILKEQELGITAVSIVRRSIIDPDPAAAEANLAHTLGTIEAAARLGAPVVCVGLHRPLTREQLEAEWFWLAPSAGDRTDDESLRRRLVEGLQVVGRAAAVHGIAISLEMYEETFLGTAREAVDLVLDIDLPNVGLNPDIGNIIRLHRPVEDWEQMLLTTLPHTNYWHVKNYYRDHDPATGAYFTTPAPLELGVINYRRALEIALESGFDGPICVEHYGGDGLSVSARNRDYLRGLLADKIEADR